jgi:hypothetical protein
MVIGVGKRCRLFTTQQVVGLSMQFSNHNPSLRNLYAPLLPHFLTPISKGSCLVPLESPWPSHFVSRFGYLGMIPSQFPPNPAHGHCRNNPNLICDLRLSSVEVVVSVTRQRRHLCLSGFLPTEGSHMATSPCHQIISHILHTIFLGFC